MWEILLLEFRASYTSKNSQVRNQNRVDVGCILTEADPQETSDDNGSRIYKQEYLKIHSNQISHVGGEPIIFGMNMQKLSEVSHADLYMQKNG